MPLVPGTRLGPYEVLAPLGAGGMGEVYRARDTRLGRDIALKLLPAHLSTDTERLARLEREARTVASLNHPNIVTLHSLEDSAGVRFLTMELVEGESLAGSVVRGGMPPARVIELGIALADALATAHERGIVHRDLKPANVMLTREGRVKVLDFGLARGAEAAPAGDASEAATLASPLSSAGMVSGTLPYMAPEQLRGEPVDARTDLFALGVVLYELTAGVRPFAGRTAADLASAILRDSPGPLAGHRADVPGDLDRIVTRCLAKLPSDRYPSARDVANELRRARPMPEAAALLKPPPMPSTPLIGRDAQLEAALARSRGDARLLCITGYGGTGKTRFAIELFRRLAPEYPGGAVFVSLASVTAASDVMPTIAATLDLAEAHGRTPLEALCALIGERPTLIVLDNLEQVLDAAGEIATLVARCPALRVIATSRAPLKVGAETEFALPPLELPAGDATSLEVLAGVPSVALFVQRAEKVRPGFTLDVANAPAIAAICRRLDGLPLALELAAARARILEPAALHQRLDRALDLLTSGDRDLPLRQRTLRAAISWSYSLLDAAEQRLLRRLSVFHEGWTLEAMEQVCYEAGDRDLALDALTSLVEKGLVRVVGAGERYTLLETIRAFAAEQLHADGEVDAVRDAHARHVQTVAEAIRRGIFCPGQLEAMRVGRAEHPNVLAALHFLRDGARAGDTDALERGLLICGGMDWFWHISALHFTAREWLDALLGLAADRPPSRGRALALLAAGMVSSTTGEWDRSLAEWTGAFHDGEAIGDRAAAAEGRMGMAYCHLSLGHMPETAEIVEDAITRARAAGVPFLEALTRALKGMQRFATGDLEAGLREIEQAVRICDRLQDDEIGGVALSFLAQMTFSKGDTARALQHYREALTRLERVGDLPEVARVHSEMGWTALGASDPAAARRAFQLAVRTNEIVGSPRGIGLALMGLAAVEAAEGRTARAVTIAAAAEALSTRAGVVIAHPMAPGLAERIAALKASVPRTDLEALIANAATLSPEAVLAMVAGT